MVKLYQVELEHYEKIEGITLALDSKANRLAADDPRQPRRRDAGPRRRPCCSPASTSTPRRHRPGRIFSYDVTGGNYEERGYAASAPFPKNSLKKTWRYGLPADDATRTVVEALYDAADDDSATGGPDPVRRLYPSSTASTPRAPSGSPTPRSPPSPTASSATGPPPIARTPSGGPEPYHGELRLARAAHARPLGVRPQGHLPWPQRRRRHLRRRRPVHRRDPSSTLHKVGELYDRIGFAAVGRYSEFESLRIAGVASPTSASTRTTAATLPAGSSPTPTRRPSARSSPSR